MCSILEYLDRRHLTLADTPPASIASVGGLAARDLDEHCGVLRGPNLLQVQAPQHAILLHPGVAHAAGMLAAARIEAQLRRQQECFPQSSNEPCWHCSKESLPILCFNGDGRH